MFRGTGIPQVGDGASLHCLCVVAAAAGDSSLDSELRTRNHRRTLRGGNPMTSTSSSANERGRAAVVLRQVVSFTMKRLDPWILQQHRVRETADLTKVIVDYFNIKVNKWNLRKRINVENH
ncbi:hypothetical protein INR49_025116 [Caranx melampygus]|nr:hypothetical protein INR49_025116 [Caranx melampygus]